MLNIQKGTQNNRPLLAVDFDDVIFDCDSALREILRREFGFSSTYSEFIKINPHIQKDVFQFLYGNYHQNCSVISGAFEAVSHLVTTHRLIVITGRSEATRAQTEKWIESNFPTIFSEVYFTNNFLSDTDMKRRKKVEICTDLGVSMLIEDSLEEAVKVASSGITVFLIDRPWNKTVSLPPNVCRVKDWNHLINQVIRNSIRKEDRMKSKYLTHANPETVKKFMTEKGWLEHKCNGCNTIFFAKPSTKVDISTCGWHKCDKGDYAFRTFIKRKKMLLPAQISAKTSEYFHSVGFDLATPANITNLKGKTDLVVAGVQMFDDIIHQGHEVRRDKVFVAQPCTRMQFQPQVESQEGTSTSFVNICTEQMRVDFNKHLESIDHWCTILSKLGLHMNNFVVIMRTSKNDWGTGEFSALELFFSYGGLELGDAAYLLIPQLNRPAIPISDIGFGLERITWAINKTESYFDTLTPWTVTGTKEMFDACRTLALLILCGVQATNKGSGLQFRRFAKTLGEKYYSTNLFEILLYYFNYWSQFISPSIEREDAILLARLEIERFVNLKICKMLNLPSPRNETTDAYLDRLVYTCNISIYELRKAIQICKT